MRTALAVALLLALPATASAKPLQCVLWPKTCEAPVAAPANPAPPLSQPAPIQAAPSLPPPPPVLHAPLPKPPAAKPRPRIKSNFAKPKPTKRRAAKGTVRWWCSFAPAGTTAAQIMSEARSRNKTVSAADAEACAASKRT